MRLLLDAHLSPALAREVRRRGVDALAMRDWEGGNYRTAPDDQVLAAALVEGRVLVTYDLRSIPALVKEWAEMEQPHGGVVLIDERTLPPNDVGGLLRALEVLVKQEGSRPWRDRVVFLRARSR